MLNKGNTDTPSRSLRNGLRTRNLGVIVFAVFGLLVASLTLFGSGVVANLITDPIKNFLASFKVDWTALTSPILSLGFLVIILILIIAALWWFNIIFPDKRSYITSATWGNQFPIQRETPSEVGIDALNTAIDQLSTTSPLRQTNPQILKNRCDLLVQRASIRIYHEGFANPLVGEDLKEADRLYQELLSRNEQTPDQFAIVWRLWTFYLVRAQLDMATTYARFLHNLARQERNQQRQNGLLMAAHEAVASTMLRKGELSEAINWFDEGISLHNPAQQQQYELKLVLGQDTGITSLIEAAWCNWLLGNLTKALEQYEAAIKLAIESNDPPTLAFTFFFATVLQQARREVWLTHSLADLTIAYCHDKGINLWENAAQIFRGWSNVEMAKSDEGKQAALKEVEQHLRTWQNSGAYLGTPQAVGFLIEQYIEAHLPPDELIKRLDTIITDAVEKNQEEMYKSELIRLRGQLELCLSPENVENAVIYFDKAINIAVEQKSMYFKLRAELSKYQVVRSRTGGAEMRKQLQQTVSWFEANNAKNVDCIDVRLAEAELHK